MSDKYNEEVIQYKGDTPLTVQVPKSLQLMLWIVFPLFIAFMLFCVSKMPREEEDYLLLVVGFGVAVLGWILLFVWVTVISIRWKLVLLEEHFEYTPSFGKTRKFSYSDLQKLSLTRSNAVALYDRQGKKLTVLSGFETNADAAVIFLRAKGIPADF